MASIRERNGKFCVIYHYMDADGKRRQKWETYKTRGEANRRKKAVEFKENQGHLSYHNVRALRIFWVNM